MIALLLAGVLSLAGSASLLFAQTAAQPRQQTAPQLDIGFAARVQPETVTVGDHFTLLLRVRAPQGATIEFPGGPDTLGAVELLTPPRLTQQRTVAWRPRPEPDTLWLEQMAGYRMAAWDTGDQPLGMPDVVVRHGAAERRMPIGEMAVFVRSVLPADTALHVPQPPRPPFTFAFPWWLLALLAALLALLLAWWLWRRLRRPKPALPPYETAEREFARIEALALPERDEGGRHVALMTDVFREYMAARVSGVLSSHTSSQLLAAAASSYESRWDESVRARAERLLARADLAKFAAARIPPDEARELGGEARWLVSETERRITAPEQKAAA